MPESIDRPDTPNLLEDARPSGTAAFSKFLAVLQCIADAATPPGIAQLTAMAGYPRPTVYRIVGALIAEGLVVETPHGGSYCLGPRLLMLASRSWERSDLRIVASETLQALRDITQETVHLAVRSGAEMVYIEKLESPHAVRMASRIGTRVTLYSSSVGKAYLSSLTRANRDALLATLHFERFTPNTIVERAVLDAELDATQARGYSEDREENEKQIFCYGGAILAANGEPLACVSVSIPLYRKSATPLATYIVPLKDACRAIAEGLGPGSR
jgi:IclR family transcriptional regulator, KDG regulon repressor